MANFNLLSLSQREPLFSFHWVCEDITFPGCTKPLEGQFVESVDIPFNNIKIGDAVHSGSGYDYFPGTHDISSFALTLFEDASCTTLKFINEWKNRIKDIQGGTNIYRVAADYKSEIVVVLRDAKGDDVLTVKLIGVWPADTGNLGLNYTDANRITISQTFSADGQELHFMK